jgi:hypothetical protein
VSLESTSLFWPSHLGKQHIRFQYQWGMRRRRDPSYDLFALLRAVKYSMYLRGGIPSTRVKSVVKLLGLL